MKRVLSFVLAFALVFSLVPPPRAQAVAFVAALPAAAPAAVEGLVAAKAIIAAGVTTGSAAVITKLSHDFLETHANFKNEVMQDAKVVRDKITGAYFLTVNMANDTWNNVRSWVGEKFNVGSNVVEQKQGQVVPTEVSELCLCGGDNKVLMPLVYCYSGDALLYKFVITVGSVADKYNITMYDSKGGVIREYLNTPGLVCYASGTGARMSTLDYQRVGTSTGALRFSSEILNSVPLSLQGEENVCDNLGWDWVNPKTSTRSLDIPLYPDETGSITIDGAPYAGRPLENVVPAYEGKTYNDVINEQLYTGEDVVGGDTTGEKDYTGLFGQLLNALNALKDFLKGLLERIASSLDAIKDKVLSLPQTLADIAAKIAAIPAQIIQGLKDLVIPREAVMKGLVSDLMAAFDGRLGILTFPIALCAKFCDKMFSITEDEPILKWNNFIMFDKVLVPAGQYNLRDAVRSGAPATMYGIYRVVVNALLAFALVDLCRRKYEKIVNN